MTAEPTTTYTSEEAYALFLAGAIIHIKKMGSDNICRSAGVVVGDVFVPITHPDDIYTWLKMDADDGIAVRLPETCGHWQHVAHAPKKMVQELLIPLAPAAKLP